MHPSILFLFYFCVHTQSLSVYTPDASNTMFTLITKPPVEKKIDIKKKTHIHTTIIRRTHDRVARARSETRQLVHAHVFFFLTLNNQSLESTPYSNVGERLRRLRVYIFNFHMLDYID